MRRAWGVVVLAFAAAVLTAGASIAYTNRAAAVSERKFCELLGFVLTQYEANPPPTDLGKGLETVYRNLHSSLGCKPSR